ncbi:MAG: LysM domain-containing protein [Candidatus Woesearchaeota archaeon]
MMFRDDNLEEIIKEAVQKDTVVRNTVRYLKASIKKTLGMYGLGIALTLGIVSYSVLKQSPAFHTQLKEKQLEKHLHNQQELIDKATGEYQQKLHQEYETKKKELETLINQYQSMLKSKEQELQQFIEQQKMSTNQYQTQQHPNPQKNTYQNNYQTQQQQTQPQSTTTNTEYKKQSVPEEVMKQWGLIITVEPKNTLSGIAKKYTGSTSSWSAFLQYNAYDNQKILKNPEQINPGDKIYINYQFLLPEHKAYLKECYLKEQTKQ